MSEFLRHQRTKQKGHLWCISQREESSGLQPRLRTHPYLCRYTAVAMPMLYNTRYSSKRRVTVMIAIVWVLSFTISCPLLFGLNNTGKSGLGLGLRELRLSILFRTVSG